MTPPSYTIPLGFAVPSGEPVLIPLGHMAVVGQTQQAGKTTTLEALAARSDRHVLAFRTKRGEGAFQDCRTHPPIFRERADWQFVQAILEATMRERMKFERGWIMRASKGARTLADVQRNVKALMATAKGLSADVYYQLDHYLDIVVPQIARIRFVGELGLTRGINVIDVTAYTPEMQALVIQSALAYVYGHLNDTIVILPEAWEFLPRARKSPVALAAEELIRKGASLHNYLWIDSQDLAGVHTPILKSVHVWLLGVQREINEVKRTLVHIHGVKKPTVDAVAGLGLGQFIACFGQTAVTTYVQPAWLSADTARIVAQTNEYGPVGSPSQRLAIGPIEPLEEDLMDATLKAENERLERENAEWRQANQELQRRVTELEARIGEQGHHVPTRGFLPKPTQADFQHDFSGRGSRIPPADATPLTIGEQCAADIHWPWLRERILGDADIQVALLKIKAQRPELVIETTPREVAFSTDAPRGRLAKMIAMGLLDQPVKPGVIVKEFERTGQQVHPSRLSEYLGEFVAMGMVTREDGGTYVKAPGLKVTTRTLQATT